jgi:hypothetical protein
LPPRRARGGDPVEADQDGRHDLHRVVVQLTRDPAALDLLRAQQGGEDLAPAPLALGERALGGDAVGDVARDHRGAGDATALRADGGQGHGDVQRRPVLAPAHRLEALDVLAGLHPPPHLARLAAPPAGDDDRHRLPDRLLGRESVQPLGADVPRSHDALEVERQDGIVRGRDHRRELAHLPRGGGHLGHVREQAPDVVDHLGPLADGEQVQEVPAAVGVRDVDVRDRLAAGEHPLDRGDHPRVDAGEGVGQAQPHVPRRDPSDVLDGLVHARDPKLAVEQHHADRRGLHDGLEHRGVRGAGARRPRRAAEHDQVRLLGAAKAVHLELQLRHPVRRLEPAAVAEPAARRRQPLEHPPQAGLVGDADVLRAPAEQLLAAAPEQAGERVADVHDDAV